MCTLGKGNIFILFFTGQGGLTGPDPRQCFSIRLVSGNRRPPVPVYCSGLAGYRLEPVEFKFEFKWHSSTGSYGIPAGLTGLPAGLTGNRSV